MNNIIINTTIAALALAALSSAETANAQSNVQQLLRCNDTNMEAGFYGQHYGVLRHGTDQICAGDPMSQGQVSIFGFRGKVEIKLQGVHANNLYEVYWLAIGADPADRIHLGGVLSDSNGEVSDTVKSLSSPSDALTRPDSQLRTLVGKREAGVFLLYSRGSYATTTDSAGNVTRYNTSDGTSIGSFNNPSLWGGASNLFDGIQFVSGYELPSFNINGPHRIISTEFQGSMKSQNR